MKSKYFENSMALLGAVLIIVAVWASASSALAGDMGTLDIYYSAQK
tara:strand:+ start:377 stop:514 length:138 start_codon:yes stop_codon:yes gene_type:complete